MYAGLSGMWRSMGAYEGILPYSPALLPLSRSLLLPSLFPLLPLFLLDPGRPLHLGRLRFLGLPAMASLNGFVIAFSFCCLDLGDFGKGSDPPRFNTGAIHQDLTGSPINRIMHFYDPPKTL